MLCSRWESVLVAGFVCVFTLMTQTSCLPVEESGPASLLSPGEQKYISRRKQTVADSLLRLGIPVNRDAIPHIALLGSGGGQRAAVSLLGSLHQMGQDDLLDTLLYLGGVSGSGWAMSFLYTDPTWSTNTDAALSRLLGGGPALGDVVEWLEERSEDEHFSLSDFWGSILSPTILKQMDRHRLSDEAQRPTTSNPYPVYSALEQNCDLGGQTKGKWFELTPHESGFTELNRFIPTSKLGSSYSAGAVAMEEGLWVEGGEAVGEVGGGSDMDMVALQGIIGSAMADKTAVLEYLPDWMRDALEIAFIKKNNIVDMLVSQKAEAKGAQGSKDTSHYDDVTKTRIPQMHILAKLLASLGDNTEDPFVKAKLEDLRAPLQDFLNDSPLPSMRLVNVQEREILFNEWIEETLNPIRTWAGTLRDGPVKSLVSMVVGKLMPLVAKWEWGTTDNFLYQSEEVTVPECLKSKKHIHLVDPGMYLNSPYPPFLGPKREMDLIISLDFSLGSSLESLILGRDYAAEVQKPFPVIDEDVLEDQDWPKDFYVFPGGLSQPTIIYMPVFNRRNCRDAAEVKAKMAEYTTVQWPYKGEKIVALLQIAMANMANNKDNLLNEIARASGRKHMRSMMSRTGNGAW